MPLAYYLANESNINLSFYKHKSESTYLQACHAQKGFNRELDFFRFLKFGKNLRNPLICLTPVGLIDFRL